jgi:hypothetical protein
MVVHTVDHDKDNNKLLKVNRITFDMAWHDNPI